MANPLSFWVKVATKHYAIFAVKYNDRIYNVYFDRHYNTNEITCRWVDTTVKSKMGRTITHSRSLKEYGPTFKEIARRMKKYAHREMTKAATS